VRVSFLKIDRFRGWRHLELAPDDHVLLSGVPRGGRSDVVEAIARALSVEVFRRGLSPSDLWQEVAPPHGTAGGDAAPASDAADDESTAASPETAVDAPVDGAAGQRSDEERPAAVNVTRSPVAEVEVTLVDLEPEVEQLVENEREPLGPDGRALGPNDDVPDGASWCLRMTYRIAHEPETDTLEHFVYFPAASNPATEQFARVPTKVRRALPVVVLGSERPLQLRGGAALRRAVDNIDPVAATHAFDQLDTSLVTAVSQLATAQAVRQAVDLALSSGRVGTRIGDQPVTAEQVGFQADDGSVHGILRSLQPTLHLDGAGPLALAAHGSTTTAALSVAEAIMQAAVPGAVVLADDFGDHLDAAGAEHLAAVLRANAGQLWMSTRRPEVARAFSPYEIIRFARRGGVRSHHRLTRPDNRKAIKARRQLHTQLLAALTSDTVAITEGPHDVAVYTTVDRLRLPQALPVSAYGVRIVCAGTGGDGGITVIPPVAKLARELGFRVIALIDHDGDSPKAAGEFAAVAATCDAVIRLPEKIAIEKATFAGIAISTVREASAAVADLLNITDPTDGKIDDKTAVKSLTTEMHRVAFHEQMIEAIQDTAKVLPPVVVDALDTLVRAASPDYAGPSVIDLVRPPDPAADAAT
jgi:hypothetical protein